MTEVLLGALGALAVLVLLCIGFALGWKASRWAAGRSGQAEEKENDREERRRLMSEQKAFREIMNYSTETAYGMNGRQLEEDSQ